jgi:hypothetical protein
MIHHVVDVTYLDKNGCRQEYRYVAKAESESNHVFETAEEDAIGFAQSCTRNYGLRIFNQMSKTWDYYPVHRVLHAIVMSFED